MAVFARAVMHAALDLASEACELARELQGDYAIGLGKAIARTSDLPILAIRTIYAGSEMTSIYGIAEGGMNRIGTDLRVPPKTVIYDPELTLTLPAQLSL